ncbi:hypothetical protein HanIR_Chr17g0879191 [Helianthus annuus]|nr:hypothetical protein HanIR_Chr17g0879191 [Helianthus annuus]
MKQSSAPRSSITTSFFPAILDRNPKSVFPKTMIMLSSSASSHLLSTHPPRLSPSISIPSSRHINFP